MNIGSTRLKFHLGHSKTRHRWVEFSIASQWWLICLGHDVWFKKTQLVRLDPNLQLECKPSTSKPRQPSKFSTYIQVLAWYPLWTFQTFPFSQSELSKKFGVAGIPTLILLNASNGKVLTKNGRSLVADDPDGEDFPWKPREFLDIICGGNFVNRDGATKSWDAIASESDILGLYFSAHWVTIYLLTSYSIYYCILWVHGHSCTPGRFLSWVALKCHSLLC